MKLFRYVFLSLAILLGGRLSANRFDDAIDVVAMHEVHDNEACEHGVQCQLGDRCPHAKSGIDSQIADEHELNLLFSTLSDSGSLLKVCNGAAAASDGVLSREVIQELIGALDRLVKWAHNDLLKIYKDLQIGLDERQFRDLISSFLQEVFKKNPEVCSELFPPFIKEANKSLKPGFDNIPGAGAKSYKRKKSGAGSRAEKGTDDECKNFALRYLVQPGAKLIVVKPEDATVTQSRVNKVNRTEYADMPLIVVPCESESAIILNSEDTLDLLIQGDAEVEFKSYEETFGCQPGRIRRFVSYLKAEAPMALLKVSSLGLTAASLWAYCTGADQSLVCSKGGLIVAGLAGAALTPVWNGCVATYNRLVK